MNCRKLLFMLAFLSAAATVYADKMWSIDEKVRKIQDELKLSQEQADQIRPILQEYKDKIDQAGDAKEDKLRKILTEDQMNQLKNKDDMDAKTNKRGILP